MIATVRRMYLIRKQHRSQCPVVVIGNISVGGNGKTTMVITLTRHFQSRGLRVGVVSKGYGRRHKHVSILVDHEMRPEIIGDENALIWQHTRALIAVGPSRNDSVKMLETKGCDIIITDDGMQDYSLYRDIEIVLTSKEGLGNQRLLPAGPLREPMSRINEANYHVELMGNEEKKASSSIGMHYKIRKLRSAKKGTAIDLKDWQAKDKKVYAMCAIGNPQNFITMMESEGFEVESIILPDHESIKNDDCAKLLGKPILITEKDAVKLSHEIIKAHNLWVVEIEATMDQMFDVMIHEMVKMIKTRQKINSKNL